MKDTRGVATLVRVLFLLLCFRLNHAVTDEKSTASRLVRSRFPKGFLFGAGTSAYQAEGAVGEGGRGPSIWDTFAHKSGKIADGSTGDVAADHYHRYKEDIQYLKYMGMDTYRFSISWPRIFPKGSPRHGGVNKEGVAYYNNVMNELRKNNIEPFVTLYHWDMPQVLEDEYGGFLSAKAVDDFALFAEECFRAFGDGVKYWTTINEPLVYAMYGYDAGLHAPGRCSAGFGNCTKGNSATEPYIVVHNLLLAHSAAVKIYRTKYQAKQKGSIGIAHVVSWYVPFSKSVGDQKAAQRAIDFRIGWFLDPLMRGHYPKSMRSTVGARLPRFTKQQAKDLKGSFDFLGLNYYVTLFAVHTPHLQNLLNTDYILDTRANITSQHKGIYIGTEEGGGASGFRSYPAGLALAINYIKHRYNNPPLYIAECGYVDFDNGTTPLKQALNDTGRVKFHADHLHKVHETIRGGADVRGYIVWALVDNFEWGSGYQSRFGLYYVDFKHNLTRYAKESARWFKRILSA